MQGLTLRAGCAKVDLVGGRSPRTEEVAVVQDDGAQEGTEVVHVWALVYDDASTPEVIQVYGDALRALDAWASFVADTVRPPDGDVGLALGHSAWLEDATAQVDSGEDVVLYVDDSVSVSLCQTVLTV